MSVKHNLGGCWSDDGSIDNVSGSTGGQGESLVDGAIHDVEWMLSDDGIVISQSADQERGGHGRKGEVAWSNSRH